MKKMKLFITTMLLTAAVSVPAWAGQWRSDAKGWWYAEDNGSYPVSQWKEINGKYYYFGADGYMLADTVTPDGYQVGADGAWIQGTDVQTGYLEKYAEVLRGMPTAEVRGYETAKFILAYVDGDAIPELIVKPREYKQRLQLYTYYQGNVKLVGEFEHGTIFNYVENRNLIYTDCFQTGMNQWDGFYRIENGELVAIAEFYSHDDDAPSVPDIFKINQQEVSEATYRSQLNAMKGGHSFKEIDYNAYHIMSEENIQKMLKDMGFAM